MVEVRGAPFCPVRPCFIRVLILINPINPKGGGSRVAARRFMKPNQTDEAKRVDLAVPSARRSISILIIITFHQNNNENDIFLDGSRSRETMQRK